MSSQGHTEADPADVWFLSHMLPGAVIEDAHGWEDRLASGLPYVFEKVVIIDRCEWLRRNTRLTIKGRHTASAEKSANGAR